jgi:hypothetical protein
MNQYYADAYNKRLCILRGQVTFYFGIMLLPFDSIISGTKVDLREQIV